MSLRADTFMVTLTDSTFCHHAQASCGHHSGVVFGHQVYDAYGQCEVVLCVASGAALLMPYDGASALQLFDEALGDERLSERFASDPTVRILVVNPAMCSAECRKAGEQYPNLVRDRRNLPLIANHTIPWTICDLEDRIMDRAQRTIFPVLEACELESRRGIYDRKDVLHFDERVGISAGDELLLAVRRQALQQYEGRLQSSILVVLAAGWNAESTDDKSRRGGPCWRKAERIALLELCALNGHPLSAVREHVQYLLQRARGNHREEFVKVPAESIVPVEPGTTAPRGGFSGQLFDDRNCTGIRSITVRQADRDGHVVLSCIETRHADGSVFYAGLASGPAQTFDVPVGRSVKKVFVRTTWYVDAISFELDDGTASEWFGGEGGEEHCFEARGGQCILGFHGRAGDLLDNVGVRFGLPSRRRDAGSSEGSPPRTRRRLVDSEPTAEAATTDDASFAQLLEMGFEESKARAALLQCSGRLESAIALLC